MIAANQVGDSAAMAVLTIMRHAEEQLDAIVVIAGCAKLAPVALELFGEAVGTIRCALALKRAELGLQPRVRRAAA